MILYECQTCWGRVQTKPTNDDCPNCGHGDFRVMVPCDCYHHEYPALVRQGRDGYDMCHECYENRRQMVLDLQESL